MKALKWGFVAVIGLLLVGLLLAGVGIATDIIWVGELGRLIMISSCVGDGAWIMAACWFLRRTEVADHA